MAVADSEERRDQITTALGGLRPRAKRWSLAVIRFARRKPLGAFGLCVLVLVALVAILAPVVAPYNPIAQNVPERLKAPSASHLMGTDELGRDVLSRIMYGARVSLYVGFLSVTVGILLGTAIGLVSGYFGGKLDMGLQRLVDTLMGFPSLVLALVMVASLGASINNVVIAVATTFTPRVARVARSAVIAIRNEDYVLAAAAVGSSNLRIITRHILPNSVAPVMVVGTAYLGTAIVVEASLSFLGLGVPPPDPSWGRMLTLSAGVFMEAAPWTVIFPGVALSTVVFSFNLFGDALRDVLDPRLRGR